MAYLGNRKMSEISPNHPFAHTYIAFGGLRITFHLNERPDLPQGGSHGVEVTVSWGYELHTAKVSARKWKRIRSGEAVMVKSIGWFEGKLRGFIFGFISSSLHASSFALMKTYYIASQIIYRARRQLKKSRSPLILLTKRIPISALITIRANQQI
jgi:hypothetical protein